MGETVGNQKNKLIMLGYNIQEISSPSGKVCAIVSKQVNGFKQTMSKYEVLKNEEVYEFIVLAFEDGDEILVAVVGEEVTRQSLLRKIAFMDILTLGEEVKNDFRVFTNSIDMPEFISTVCKQKMAEVYRFN